MNISKYVGEQIKHFRTQKNITQQELGEYLNTTSQTVSRYESGILEANQDILFKLAEYFKVSINDFFPPLDFNNTIPIELPKRIVKIPILGTIKAGIPIEAQQDILEYVDIPEEWTKGGKKFYGLKISGDSMEPKYNEKDIVIFEHTNDYSVANNKDCAVMVNSDDVTFKNVSISEAGITLIPGNLNNSDGYKPTFYSIEQIEKLPVKIIGIAREKRTRL